MSDKPAWRVLSCPACKSGAFWARYDEKAGKAQVLCSGCNHVLTEREIEKR